MKEFIGFEDLKDMIVIMNKSVTSNYYEHISSILIEQSEKKYILKKCNYTGTKFIMQHYTSNKRRNIY